MTYLLHKMLSKFPYVYVIITLYTDVCYNNVYIYHID